MVNFTNFKILKGKDISLPFPKLAMVPVLMPQINKMEGKALQPVHRPARKCEALADTPDVARLSQDLSSSFLPLRNGPIVGIRYSKTSQSHS